MSEPANAHEERARARKVGALVKVIADEGIDVDLIGKLDDIGWEILARNAGVNPPSKTTRALVLEAIKED